MNARSEENVKRVSPAGDMLVFYHIPCSLHNPLRRYPENMRQPNNLKELSVHVEDKCAFWRPYDTKMSVREVPSIFVETYVPGLIVNFQLRDNFYHQIEKHFESEFYLGLGNKAKIHTVVGHLFDTGALMIDFIFEVENGWKHAEAPSYLNFITRTLPENIIEFLKHSLVNLSLCIDGFLKKSRSARHGKAYKSVPLLSNDDVLVPYVDFVFGGQTEVSKDGRVPDALDERYRGWVQVGGRGAVPNQSPNLGEFVFVGTTFGLVLAHEVVVLKERFQEIAMMWAIYGAFYFQMTAICAEIVKDLPRLRRGVESDLSEYEHQLQIYFNELAAPSLTYRRDLRIYRESIFHEWDMNALYQRSAHLLTLLASWQHRTREQKTEFWRRIVGGVLAMITAMSLISAVWDSIQMHNYFLDSEKGKIVQKR